MSAPLPEAVERALVAFSDSISDMENGHATNDDAVRAEDALRAAIAAAIEAALEAECEACAEVASRTFDATKRESVECAQRCAAAIRARGGAK